MIIGLVFATTRPLLPVWFIGRRRSDVIVAVVMVSVVAVVVVALICWPDACTAKRLGKLADGCCLPLFPRHCCWLKI